MPLKKVYEKLKTLGKLHSTIYKIKILLKYYLHKNQNSYKFDHF